MCCKELDSYSVLCLESVEPWSHVVHVHCMRYHSSRQILISLPLRVRYQSAYYSVSPPVHENGYRLERVKFKEIPQISSSSRQQNLCLLDVFDYTLQSSQDYSRVLTPNSEYIINSLTQRNSRFCVVGFSTQLKLFPSYWGLPSHKQPPQTNLMFFSVAVSTLPPGHREILMTWELHICLYQPSVPRSTDNQQNSRGRFVAFVGRKNLIPASRLQIPEQPIFNWTILEVFYPNKKGHKTTTGSAFSSSL